MQSLLQPLISTQTVANKVQSLKNLENMNAEQQFSIDAWFQLSDITDVEK